MTAYLLNNLPDRDKILRIGYNITMDVLKESSPISNDQTSCA